MDEHLTRAPDAHQHLATVQDGRIREQLERSVRGLTHVELVNETGTFMGTAYEHVPPETHDAEQASLYAGTEGLVIEVSRLTALASAELEESIASAKPAILNTLYDRSNLGVWADEPKRLEILDIFVRAKQIGLDEAVAAKTSGDAEGASRAMKSVLAVGLVGETLDIRDSSEVLTAVSHGLGDELLNAIDETRGVVAVSVTGEALSNNERRLSESGDVIRLATGKDFGPQFEEIRPLPQDSADQGNTRAELLDRLSSQELIALSEDSASNKHDPTQGAYLAVKATEALKTELESWGSVTPTQIADTLVAADHLTTLAHDETGQDALQQTLKELRRYRSVGLIPYRINIRGSERLDHAIAKLAHDGHTELAAALISVSTHDNGSQDPNDDNLNRAVRFNEEIPDEDKADTMRVLSGLHHDKTVAFREQLLAKGASNDTIETLIRTSYDPDSASDIPSDFWADYYEALGADDMNTLDKALREIVEGPADDISEIARSIHPLLIVKKQEEFKHSRLFDVYSSLQNQPEAFETLLTIIDYAQNTRNSEEGPANIARVIVLLDKLQSQHIGSLNKVWEVATRLYDGNDGALQALTEDSDDFLNVYGIYESLTTDYHDSFYRDIKDTVDIFGAKSREVNLHLVSLIKDGMLEGCGALELGVTEGGVAGLQQLKTTIETLKTDMANSNGITVDRLISHPILAQEANNFQRSAAFNEGQQPFSGEVQDVLTAISVIKRVSDSEGPALWKLAQEIYGENATHMLGGNFESFSVIGRVYLQLEADDRLASISHIQKAIDVFGSDITFNGIQAVTQIMDGDTSSPSLQLIGVTKQGEAGINQLKAFFGTFREQLFANGDIPVDILLNNPLALDLFKAVTRYDVSQWGGAHAEASLVRMLRHDQDSPPRLPEGYAIGEIRVETTDAEALKAFEISEDGISQWRSYAAALERASQITDRNGNVNWEELGLLLSEIQDGAAGRAEDIERGLSQMRDKIKDLEEKEKDTAGIKRRLGEQEANLYELQGINYSAVNDFTITSLTEQITVLAKHRDIVQTGQLQTLLMAVAMAAGAANDVNTPTPWWDPSVYEPRLEEVIDMADFVGHIVNQETWAGLFETVGGQKTLNQILSTDALDANINRSTSITTAGTKPFRIIPARGALLELSGHIGDACWAGKYESITDQFPNFTALTFIQNPDTPSRRMAGSALLIETTSSAGEPLLVIRGLNPLQNVITQLSPESFYSEIAKYVKELAERTGRKAAIVIDNHAGGSATNRPTLYSHLASQQPQMQQVALAGQEGTTFNGYNIVNNTYLI